MKKTGSNYDFFEEGKEKMMLRAGFCNINILAKQDENC